MDTQKWPLFKGITISQASHRLLVSATTACPYFFGGIRISHRKLKRNKWTSWYVQKTIHNTLATWPPHCPLFRRLYKWLRLYITCSGFPKHHFGCLLPFKLSGFSWIHFLGFRSKEVLLQLRQYNAMPIMTERIRQELIAGILAHLRNFAPFKLRCSEDSDLSMAPLQKWFKLS